MLWISWQILVNLVCQGSDRDSPSPNKSRPNMGNKTDRTGSQLGLPWLGYSSVGWEILHMPLICVTNITPARVQMCLWVQGVENQVQLAAIYYCSVACVLEGQQCKVTRKGPMGLRVSMKSGVSRVFLEWIWEVWSSNSARQAEPGLVSQVTSGYVLIGFGRLTITREMLLNMSEGF